LGIRAIARLCPKLKHLDLGQCKIGNSRFYVETLEGTFHSRFWKIVQGNYPVTVYYLRLKKYNETVMIVSSIFSCIICVARFELDHALVEMIEMFEQKTKRQI
jgi:hypothetical protein